MSLRTLVAEALIGDGTNPWADRVVETAGATPDEHLPWLTGGQQPWVIVRGGVTSVVGGSNARMTSIEVWPHGPMTAWTGIDNLEDLVVRILGGSVVSTPPGAEQPDGYLLTYESSPLGDQVIEEWEAWTRPIRFNAARLGWYGADDPRAAYLRSITPAVLCGTWDCVQTTPESWVPTDQCPGIYWRPDTGPAEVERYSAVTFYREVLAGHIVAPSQRARDLWADRVALSLPGDVLYVQPGVPDGGTGVPPRRSTMLLSLLSVAPLAEPLSDGQLRVEVQFSELACDYPPNDSPLRQAVAYLPEGVHVTVPPDTATPHARRSRS